MNLLKRNALPGVKSAVRAVVATISKRAARKSMQLRKKNQDRKKLGFNALKAVSD